MVFFSKHKTFLVLGGATLVILGMVFWLGGDQRNYLCPMDAKICPDGSTVGRVGSQCEFAECPGLGSGVGWKTSVSSDSGVSFQYPESLSTKYIHVVDWPPEATVAAGPFSCLEAGAETERAGVTERRMVDDRVYCVTKRSEGAAGSIYALYAYATPKDDRVMIFTFSLRSPQCGNYDEAERVACEGEKETFDLDSVIDRIAQTARMGGN